MYDDNNYVWVPARGWVLKRQLSAERGHVEIVTKKDDTIDLLRAEVESLKLELIPSDQQALVYDRGFTAGMAKAEAQNKVLMELIERLIDAVDVCDIHSTGFLKQYATVKGYAIGANQRPN